MSGMSFLDEATSGLQPCALMSHDYTIVTKCTNPKKNSQNAHFVVCDGNDSDPKGQPGAVESSDDIGGLWRFQENPEPDRASIYHSVIINTSKEMTCFSDFPIPGHFPNFMHNSLIMDYFQKYADNFQLTKHIRFNGKGQGKYFHSRRDYRTVRVEE